MNKQQVFAKINNVSLLDIDKLNNLQKFIKLTKKLPGDMAEFGVYKGGSAFFIRWCCQKKTLHLFDTFAGCPENDTHKVGHKKGEFMTNLDEVKKFLGQQNYVYHVGYFPDTAQGLNVKYSFVHVDCDLEKGVRDAVNYFWPRLTVGGVIAFDDYGWRRTPGVKLVVNKFFSNHNIQTSPCFQAFVIKKPTVKLI